jgi:hypothetical protein
MLADMIQEAICKVEFPIFDDITQMCIGFGKITLSLSFSLAAVNYRGKLILLKYIRKCLLSSHERKKENNIKKMFFDDNLYFSHANSDDDGGSHRRMLEEHGWYITENFLRERERVYIKLY